MAGIIAPGGHWAARCPGNGEPALAVTDLDPATSDSSIRIARGYARPGRRTARAGLYDETRAHADPRSHYRTSF